MRPFRDEESEEHEPFDLRLPLLGGAAWLGGLTALLLPVPTAAVVSSAVLALGVLLVLRAKSEATRAAGYAIAFALVASVSLLRQASVSETPVHDLAGARAYARLTGQVTSDPLSVPGARSEVVVVRVRVDRVAARGQTFSLSSPIVVFATESGWSGLRLGSRIRFSGIVRPADRRLLAAEVGARGPPVLVSSPAPWWSAAERIRGAVRESVASRDPDARALVPALVVGDRGDIDDELAADFDAAGLTHLLAVSGTNLTLMLGFLGFLARWLGVRGRWQHVVTAMGVAGFLLLARTEPSVVRAAAMGLVGSLALTNGGRGLGGRALGAAVLGALLVSPGLAGDPGFALSVMATGGIVYLAPAGRDALQNWMPRWLAEAIAVSAAAQLACTPVLVALSGQVSLVAVAANLVAGPAVAPATICGFVAGFAGALWPAGGRLAGLPAAWCAEWIVGVARAAASPAMPAVEWSARWPWLVLLTGLCATGAWFAPRLLTSPLLVGGCSVLVLVAVLVPLPSPGWPPAGWVAVVCDVGQGDALAINAGGGAAVLVDVGPDPAVADRCLRRLRVRQIPLLVLTHFHADHVDGLSGVVAGRSVDTLVTTDLMVPRDRARQVGRLAATEDIEVRVGSAGMSYQVGAASVTLLGPIRGRRVVEPVDDGSGPNNASVVVLAEVKGIRILATGDIEPESQASLARAAPDLNVDVLKVPHHGSRFQDFDVLSSWGARVALISAGKDNDYGHPAPETLRRLGQQGARVWRTDRHGDLVVVVRAGRLGVTGSGHG
ncbi:MAG: ComEC/Rec2 family competence protein [Nocardioides sp.]